MKKNFYRIYISSIILFLFLCLVVGCKKNISIFQFNVSQPKEITANLLQDYYSDTVSLQKDASMTIAKITLENLDYLNWLEYAEYIDILIYKSKVTPKSNGDLIVALNLSKDIAVIGIYTFIDGSYIFTYKIEELLPIKHIQFISVPQTDYQFIVSNQRLDERFGAFFEEEFIEIFVFSHSDFKSAWKKTNYLNEIYNAQWIDSCESPEKWFQTIEDNIIQFKENETMKISVSIRMKKLEALNKVIPPFKDFKAVLDINTEELFYWNPDYQQFIIRKSIAQPI